MLRWGNAISNPLTDRRFPSWWVEVGDMKLRRDKTICKECTVIDYR